MPKRITPDDSLKTIVVPTTESPSHKKSTPKKGGTMKKIGGCFTGLLKLMFTLLSVTMGIGVAFTYFSALQTDTFEWAVNIALVMGVFALFGSFLALAQKKRVKKYMLAMFAALLFVSGLVPYLAAHPEQNDIIQSNFQKARSSVEDAIESFTEPSVEITRDEEQAPAVVPVNNSVNAVQSSTGLNLEGVEIESALDLNGLNIRSAK